MIDGHLGPTEVAAYSNPHTERDVDGHVPG